MDVILNVSENFRIKEGFSLLGIYEFLKVPVHLSAYFGKYFSWITQILKILALYWLAVSRISSFYFYVGVLKWCKMSTPVISVLILSPWETLLLQPVPQIIIREVN